MTGNQRMPTPEEITVVTHGDISEEEIEYARDRVRTVLAKITEPVLLARVKLTFASDPARTRPAIAQALLDVDGDLVRAHMAAETAHVATDLLQRRLRDKLDHRSQRRKAVRKRRSVPEPGEWRHGDPPTNRPDYYNRPPAERQLVRKKTYAIDELTPDEAVFEMEQLDYDFHLFRDLTSGQDALIERDGEASYRLTLLHATDAELGPTDARVVSSRHPVPALSVEEAINRLEATGQRFLFYASTTDHRGNVVYHRYDGHYGLIAPV
ncbi:MAG TPA: sigma 54 modulation/S30EA ribosomal C-terminal domain-containing protein [Acidimicrobiia bacterium]